MDPGRIRSSTLPIELMTAVDEAVGTERSSPATHAVRAPWRQMASSVAALPRPTRSSACVVRTDGLARAPHQAQSPSWPSLSSNRICTSSGSSSSISLQIASSSFCTDSGSAANFLSHAAIGVQ